MVGELVPAAEDVAEDGLAAGDLRADDEEGGVGARGGQGGEDGRGVLRGGVVDGQGHEGLGARQPDAEEHVGPAVGEVADQGGGGFVDDVEGEEHEEEEEEGQEEGGHAAAAEAAEEGGVGFGAEGGEQHQGGSVGIFLYDLLCMMVWCGVLVRLEVGSRNRVMEIGLGNGKCAKQAHLLGKKTRSAGCRGRAAALSPCVVWGIPPRTQDITTFFFYCSFILLQPHLFFTPHTLAISTPAHSRTP